MRGPRAPDRDAPIIEASSGRCACRSTPLATESVQRIRRYWADSLRQVPDELLAEVVPASASLARAADAISG